MTGYPAGLALLTANRVFIAFLPLVIVSLAVHVPREEQMMTGDFGED